MYPGEPVLVVPDIYVKGHVEWASRVAEMDLVLASFSRGQTLHGGGYGPRKENIVKKREAVLGKHIIREGFDHVVGKAARAL